MFVKVLLTLGVLLAVCLARPEDAEGTVATDGSCATSGSGDGRCVPYYLCKEGQIIGSDTIVDIRYPMSPCASYIDICCQKEQIEEKKP